MKHNRISITTIIAAATLLAGAGTSLAVNRTLILLQENSNGKSYMTDILPAGAIRTAADAIIDSVAENGEAAKFQALRIGHYQHFINLTDVNCTRKNLLDNLIDESANGYTVDLAILGHGGTESLNLYNNEKLTGSTVQPVFLPNGTSGQLFSLGNIRSLLMEARARKGAGFNFKLRLVHMCNCFAGTVNDDWLAIGARVAVGAPMMDWMPEPMNTLFWNDFLNNDKHVAQAASDSLTATRFVWQVVPGYSTVQANGMTKREETRQLVTGDGNIIFKDECQMAVNEERTVTVNANKAYTFPHIYQMPGQRYSYTATGSWSGSIPLPYTDNSVTANGFTPGLLDGLRRNPANMMCLIGEVFAHDDAFSFISGSGFRIGASNTVTASRRGFLNLYANDLITAYLDNSGSVSVRIRRIE